MSKLPELERLQSLFDAMNLTVAEIADTTGIAERTILNYRWNNAPIGGALLRQLHVQYGASVDWLLSGVGEMFVDAPLPQQPSRLLPNFAHTDTSTVRDLFWRAAVEIEESLIDCGAVPGQDYSIIDLYRLAAPIAAEDFASGRCDFFNGR